MASTAAPGAPSASPWWHGTEKGRAKPGLKYPPAHWVWASSGSKGAEGLWCGKHFPASVAWVCLELTPCSPGAVWVHLPPQGTPLQGLCATKAAPFSSLFVQFFISAVHLTAPVLGSDESKEQGAQCRCWGTAPGMVPAGLIAGSQLCALLLAGINQLTLLKNYFCQFLP